jgi:hypothetical protein
LDDNTEEIEKITIKPVEIDSADFELSDYMDSVVFVQL